MLLDNRDQGQGNRCQFPTYYGRKVKTKNSNSDNYIQSGVQTARLKGDKTILKLFQVKQYSRMKEIR